MLKHRPRPFQLRSVTGAEKERVIMKSNNQINIPQAREAMDKFKMQAASEVGVNEHTTRTNKILCQK